MNVQRSVGNRVAVRERARPAVQRSTEEPAVLSPHDMPAGFHEVNGIVVCFDKDGGALQHAWIEMGEESYGWYPRNHAGAVNDPIGDTVIILVGTAPGSLNAQTWSVKPGTPTRDRAHGKSAYRFSVAAPVGLEYADIAPVIRGFATSFRGVYSLNPWGTDCREFVEMLLAEGNLVQYRKLPDAPAPTPAIAVADNGHRQALSPHDAAPMRMWRYGYGSAQ